MKESDWFMIGGIILIAIGILWRFGFGTLPGDIRIEKESFRFYFPITSSIIISVLVTLAFWLYRRFS